MLRLPIALQLFSVRDDMEADFAGTLKRVKELGYDGVEFAGLYGNSATQVKALCEQLGLVPVSAHVPFADMLADPEGVIATYSEIGCRQIVLPYLTEEYRPGSDGFVELIEYAKKWGALCKAHGLKLAYHNHDLEFVKVGDAYALDVLYSEVPADRLESQLDTCWVFVGGEDPVAYVKKYAGREYTVHLKDFWMRPDNEKAQKNEQLYQLIGIDDGKQVEAEADSNFCFRPLGYGLQNVPAIIDAAQQAGAEWLVVEQDSPSMGKTPMECADMSIRYLKTL